MNVFKDTVSCTVSSGGALTTYSSYLNGLLDYIEYVPHATNAFDNTVDMTITNDDTGESILAVTNISAGFIKRPTAALQTTAGVDVSGAVTNFSLSGQRIKIVLAQGGNAKQGTFRFGILQ